jgi:Fungalysin metallopeptidase (M36)
MSRGRTHRALVGALAALSLLPAASAYAATERVQAKLARVDAPRHQLVAAGRVEVPGGGLIHRYSQRIGGLPVLGAQTVVADSPDAPPVVVADSTVNGLEPRSAAGTISERRAVNAALSSVGASKLRAPAHGRLGIDPRTGGVVWEVSLPAARPLGDFLVTVDARSAKTLRSRDLLWRATGSGAVYNPNPVVEQANSYAGLSDNKDRDSDLLTSLRMPVSLERLTSAKGCLVGTYVDARVGKKAKSVCRSTLDFTDLTRSDDAFEAVMAYFHIDRTRAYVDSLGLSQALRAKPQKVRVDAIPDDNSYFSSMSRSMTIGEGGVDDGEDADVIVHEYGHSLQDQAVHNFGRSTAGGAIGEGFGDYNAAMMSALTTGGDFKSSVCIFDWDGISYSKSGCGRRADKSWTIEKAKTKCGLEIHCMGQVWSSMLFELRQLIGNDANGQAVIDRDVLESHFLYTPKISFHDAANALLAADQMLYAGAHAATIEAELVQRKFCPAAGC